jgi:hypothetical protein
MLELALAERECDDPALREKAEIHYASAKKAVDELVRNLDNIETEGEMTLEDGMISCSALQIGMFALTLPEEERAEYIKAAEYMLSIHSCLEQQLIPDSRMNGASIRYWESQYDVMIRENMFNSPHGWTGWTLYAHYYLYMLTGKKKYLMSLMNGMGAGSQLIDENGNLRWAFCAAPYIKADRAFEKTAYYTVENSVSLFFGQTLTYLCEWTKEGEHRNYMQCSDDPAACLEQCRKLYFEEA